jgi:hypothetical protein
MISHQEAQVRASAAWGEEGEDAEAEHEQDSRVFAVPAEAAGEEAGVAVEGAAERGEDAGGGEQGEGIERPPPLSAVKRAPARRTAMVARQVNFTRWASAAASDQQRGAEQRRDEGAHRADDPEGGAAPSSAPMSSSRPTDIISAPQRATAPVAAATAKSGWLRQVAADRLDAAWCWPRAPRPRSRISLPANRPPARKRGMM